MTDEFEGFAFGTPPPGFIEHIQRQPAGAVHAPHGQHARHQASCSTASTRTSSELSTFSLPTAARHPR